MAVIGARRFIDALGMSRTAVLLVIGSWLAAAAPAWPYDCPYFTIDPPPVFPAPMERTVSGAQVYGFLKEPAGPGQLASMIMIHVFDPGNVAALTQQEKDALAEENLRLFLESLAYRRTEFSGRPSEAVTVGNHLGRKAMWEAKSGHVNEVGILYSLIAESRVFLIRVETDASQLERILLPAARAVESMIIKPAAAAAPQQDPGTSGAAIEGRPLRSLHGTVWTAYDVDPDIPAEDLPFIRSEVWARDDLTRYESRADGKTTVGIQRGPVMYSFVEGEATGVKVRLRGGIGALGLIRQIEMIKSLGKRVETEVVDGVVCDSYVFPDEATGEFISTRLSRETSVPDVWVGRLPNGHVTIVYYENVEANVGIPDDRFRIPDGVAFASGPD